jgi:hypothetical protein
MLPSVPLSFSPSAATVATAAAAAARQFRQGWVGEGQFAALKLAVQIDQQRELR